MKKTITIIIVVLVIAAAGVGGRRSVYHGFPLPQADE